MVTEDSTEQADYDDLEQRRCRTCKRPFWVQPGQKVRVCPHCGSSQVRGEATASFDDPRAVRPMGTARAKGL